MCNTDHLHFPDGLKIHYGEDREHWKATANLHGRTKFNRNKGTGEGSKNDGRPPDTAKALLTGRKSKKQIPPLVFEKGYKWKDNSCWLDAGLTAVFAAASRDYSKSMDPMLAGLPNSHPLLDLRQLVHTRLNLDVRGYEEGGCTVLSNQRDRFRAMISKLPRTPLKSLSDFQTPFVSCFSHFCCAV